MYLWFFLWRQEVLLLDEHLGPGHGDGHRRLVEAERRQADVQVKAQRRLAADPWIHLLIDYCFLSPFPSMSGRRRRELKTRLREEEEEEEEE